MIDREGGKLKFVCDECDDDFESEEGETFYEAWNAAKDAGWQARKIGDDWVHICCVCEHLRIC